MNYHKHHMITAITLMAVICLGLLVTGCATKRDIKDINDRLGRIEENAHAARAAVARMDSVITTNTEASQKLQNDVRYSSEELATQINQLLQNYNDLMARIDQLTRRPDVIKLPPTSSPGAQTDKPTAADVPPPPATAQSTECIDAYDSAFTLVRRGEYDKAISGFQAFIAKCPTHENVQNALFWTGESYYSQEKYTQAIEQYQKLVEAYPDSPNLSRALYKLARCNQELGKKAEAKKLYQQLVKDYAGTLEARQAEERLKDL